MENRQPLGHCGLWGSERANSRKHRVPMLLKNHRVRKKDGAYGAFPL